MRRSSSTYRRCRRCAAGSAYYVGHFAQLLPYLPTHTKGNPPGPLVAMHLLGLTTPGRLAAACVVVGSLVTPLTYALGRSLGSGVDSGARAGGASNDGRVDAERRGRVAATFAAFSPCVLIYGFTSVDFVFAAMAAAVAWLLVSRRGPVVALGCVAAGVAVVLLMGAAGDPGLGGGRRLRPRRPRRRRSGSRSAPRPGCSP